MNGKVVLVTGGAGNLGQEVTRTLLDAGARVAVPFYRTDVPSALDHLAAEYGDRLHAFALDLTTERGSEQSVRQVVEWGRELHSVIHLVGGFSGGTGIAETPYDLWSRMLELNLTSAFLVARFAIPHLLQAGGGSFVFVSSRAAFDAPGGRAAYAVAKGGLLTLTRAIADEHGAEGIRANVIVPDTIDTAENRRGMPHADPSGWISPAAVAQVVLFLASEASNVVNGAAIPLYREA